MHSLCFVSGFFLFSSLSVPGCPSWMTVAIYFFFATTLVPHLFVFCKGRRCKKSIFSKSTCRRAKGLWAERCGSRMPGHLVEVMICRLHTFRLHSQWGLSICDYWWCNQNFTSIDFFWDFLGIYRSEFTTWQSRGRLCHVVTLHCSG